MKRLFEKAARQLRSPDAKRDRCTVTLNRFLPLLGKVRMGCGQNHDQIKSLPTLILPNQGGRLVAFTLAEVLITLGIVGVVAALTIPTLVANYKKQAYVTQLRKTMSVISQAINMMKAEEDVPSFANTKLYSLISEGKSNEEVAQEAKKYLQVIKSCYGGDCGMGPYKSLDGSDRLSGPPAWDHGQEIYTFYLADGSVIGMYTPGYHHNGVVDIIVDINGTKAPNQDGRDVFRLAVDPKDIVVPWDDSGSGQCYIDGTDGDPCNTNSYGWCCAQRIMKEGWKMNY